MGKNKFLHIKHSDRGYFRKATVISMVTSVALLGLAFAAYDFNKIMYFALILLAVFAFRQGREFTNKHDKEIYLSIDNYAIDINNKFMFMIGQKRNVRISFWDIKEINILGRKLEIITDKSKSKIFLNAIDAESESKLLHKLGKRVKIKIDEAEVE
nr:hypothetical protein [Clostridioides sp.]